MADKPHILRISRNKCRGHTAAFEFISRRKGQKQAKAKAPFGGPARDINERRYLANQLRLQGS